MGLCQATKAYVPVSLTKKPVSFQNNYFSVLRILTPSCLSQALNSYKCSMLTTYDELDLEDLYFDSINFLLT